MGNLSKRARKYFGQHCSSREVLKRELAKEPLEPEYHEDEYEPPCKACEEGTCPVTVYYGDGRVEEKLNGDFW